ncbi:MAG: SH3 domain-containing protein [Coriobacteriia bacterium]|nr:SH3 domain-containing protein [Coriobacteriia bacterium]
MRRDRESDRGYGDVGGLMPQDPYAELYHEVEPPLLVRIVRVVVPWIALIAVITVALSLWSAFQFESGRVNRVGESTATVEPTGTVDSESEATTETDSESATPESETSQTAPEAVSTDKPYVRVKVDDLNMRAGASTDSAVIKQLPTGAILAHLESANGWYRVRDESGSEGWVAAGGSFTELVTP